MKKVKAEGGSSAKPKVERKRKPRESSAGGSPERSSKRAKGGGTGKVRRRQGGGGKGAGGVVCVTGQAGSRRAAVLPAFSLPSALLQRPTSAPCLISAGKECQPAMPPPASTLTVSPLRPSHPLASLTAEDVGQPGPRGRAVPSRIRVARVSGWVGGGMAVGQPGAGVDRACLMMPKARMGFVVVVRQCRLSRHLPLPKIADLPCPHLLPPRPSFRAFPSACSVKMLYDGVPVDLTAEQEEVASFFAVMKETGRHIAWLLPSSSQLQLWQRARRGCCVAACMESPSTAGRQAGGQAGAARSGSVWLAARQADQDGAPLLLPVSRAARSGSPSRSTPTAHPSYLTNMCLHPACRTLHEQAHQSLKRTT